ncbi:MAG: Xaa-Pro aminopeptidase [Bacteroidetes bacterium RBG_13_43_22]|nr:MAG: Xaa-Pro aminopeptidase [Bacteroidetes bacterium RBG_13_43_22]
MFSTEVYKKRRARLHEIMKSGLAVFIGNVEAPVNYPGNTYHFRQDSSFLYYFGIDLPDLAGIMDFDTGKDIIYGNDFILDDIIWMGPQPTVKELALKCGVTVTASLSELSEKVAKEKDKGRRIHFLPPYRGETRITLGSLLRENPCQLGSSASPELIKAVVSMRSIKEELEIKEIEKALGTAYDMHVTAMKMCKPGIKEQDIFGALEGIAYAQGAGPSFPSIISINGQTLHNHSHHNILKKNDLLVNDSGAETNLHYASDITRTIPVGGKFNLKQKEIYEIVLKANTESIKNARPGLSNKTLHLSACKIIASGLKELGLMKGDIDSAVAAGAHALFMPHGLGHMLGLDVHDMEALGENYIGYDNQTARSKQFGLAYLRFALPFKSGHVLTVEPGCYFIPELINMWKKEGKFKEFINYKKAESYRNFGGIRIEDDILITEKGHRVLGKPIPKTVTEIEKACTMK